MGIEISEKTNTGTIDNLEEITEKSCEICENKDLKCHLCDEFSEFYNFSIITEGIEKI
ncbi:hypothetical protein NEF87_004416 [Candidatus Lokiarchaeum ossiferum]|uniref:Uncharacterized protein n=1 Tax=Candidatus Lokiarchaeum ossiferum TaxID=2951803 RepID=A0ABY6HX79_9ARCH|nr:hypothetical protein NEF87_004416 [Candidatus Lokiarchaeum sp. B-35]